MEQAQFQEAVRDIVSTRATGWLLCTTVGGSAQIPFREGAVIPSGMSAVPRWQGPLAALVQRGSLTPSQLDAIWARGEGAALQVETPGEFGVTPEMMDEAFVVSNLKEVQRRIIGVRFEAGVVGDGPSVDGPWLMGELGFSTAQSAQETAPVEATWAAEIPENIEPRVSAVEHLQRAEAAFRKRDFRAAEEAYGLAFSLDGLAPTLAAQAWCVYMDPSRKGEGALARELLHRALVLDAQCEKAHYYLGLMARVENELSVAEEHFRAVVRINPQHLEGNQELRAIESRRRKTEAKTDAGAMS